MKNRLFFSFLKSLLKFSIFVCLIGSVFYLVILKINNDSIKNFELSCKKANGEISIEDTKVLCKLPNLN